MSAYLHVLLLLLCPAIPTPATATPEQWAALKQIALDLEVVGPRERWVPDFRSEVRYVRAAACDLADAPPIADAQRLPAADHAAGCCQFNEAFQRHLDAVALTSPADAERWRSAREETRRLGGIWADIGYAADDSFTTWMYRRRRLRCLREALGEADYAAGRWPACVPVWAFREMP